MNDILQEMKLDLFTPINQEKFMKFYLNISKKYSNQNNEGNNLIGNAVNNSNKNLTNHGFVGLNKNSGNKYKENNHFQNQKSAFGNKVYTLGSFSRKENMGINNTHKNNGIVNQKRVIRPNKCFYI